GFGDMIQFIRYAPLLAQRGATVMVACQGELADLFGRLDGVSRIVREGEKLPTTDFHLGIGSLPQLFTTRPGNIPVNVPYLRASGTTVAPLDRFRVGVVWAGRPVHRNDQN